MIHALGILTDQPPAQAPATGRKGTIDGQLHPAYKGARSMNCHTTTAMKRPLTSIRSMQRAFVAWVAPQGGGRES